MTEEQVFLAALDLPDATARAAYLDKTCGADSKFRRQVEALLASHFRSGEFLDVPAAEQIKAVSNPDNTVTVQGDSVSATKNSDEDSEGLEFLTPSKRPDSLGRIGHYEVLQILGKGGFGIVFRAFDDILQRVVAVKVMAPQLAATSPARKRFLREARTSAAVRHENVVQVHEVAEQPLPYLVMEFIPGETLQQRLDRCGPLEAAEVVRIGRQIAEGLAAAHATDLIHRDIKPGNVLLEGGQHKVKITDFGLARAADDASISQSGIIAGTPMYMAPEQALGNKLDQRADLFSLGSVLYQMVAGRAPFRATGTVAVLKRVAEDTPRSIREIIPETPQWLCDIISKLHAKNPDERFQSAREVADLLADCESQLKTNSRLKDFSRIPQSKPSPAGNSGRWKWAAAAALLLPVLVLVATEIAGVTHLLREEQLTVAVNPKVDPKMDPKSSPVPGRFALAFDGEKSVVSSPLLIVEDHAVTVEAWTVLEQPADQPKSCDLLGNIGSRGGFTLYSPLPLHDGDGKKLAFMTRLTQPVKHVIAWEKQPVPRHQLIHVAGVYDGNAEIRFYVNGQLQSRAPAQNIKPTPSTFLLGNNRAGDGGFLGRMHEVRVSKIARYDKDFTPVKRFEPDPDTIALYHFDEGEGDILKDSSGNGHHGVILGAKWVKADGSPVNTQITIKQEPLPPTFTNSIGMEFVKVPKGKSWLGGGKDKLGDKEVEIPADFYLGKYEVTQEEWEKVMGENPSHFSRTGEGKEAVKEIKDADLKQFPVENVSWGQCQVFVAKLNQREKETGWVYRLPTEVEWEYACRGGPTVDKLDSAFDFYFAKPTNTLLPEQANFNRSLMRTCKVGSTQPNRLGLYDMHGNASEWCADLLDNGLARVRMGGSWTSAASDCRVSHRYRTDPLYRGQFLGVRLARVPSEAHAPEAKTPPAVAPFTDADAQRIAALPAVEQVEEVRKEFVRRNPGFDGKFEHKIQGDVVTELQIVTDKVTDISPIRVWNDLRWLKCNGSSKPNGQLADLTPLRGMNLASLTRLELQNTKVTDASMVYFKDRKNLTHLNLGNTNVTDAGLIHFKDCEQLNWLALNGTKVSGAGLAYLKGVRLTGLLQIEGTSITDVTSLRDMPLEGIRLTPKNIARGLDILRDMKSLKTIGIRWDQAWPAAEFWERYDKGEFGKAAAPFTDADDARIAALPAAEQVDEVRKELMRRNLDFDGKVEHKIEGDVVTELRVLTDKVTDIAPIRVFNSLRSLDLNGTHTNSKGNGQLADLSPLAGMNLAGLTRLNLSDTMVDTAGMLLVVLNGYAGMAPCRMEIEVVAVDLPEDVAAAELERSEVVLPIRIVVR